MYFKKTDDIVGIDFFVYSKGEEMMGLLYFIVNRTAGTGKTCERWNVLSGYLKAHQISYKAYETKYKGHAAKLAKKISSLPEDKIYLIVVGGDGTINEVLNGITDFQKVRLGVISSGSGNDFSNGVGITGSPVERLEKILQNAKTDTYREMDLGEVSSPAMEQPRKFGISSGLGMDAIVCKKALTSPLKKVLNTLHLGNLTYVLLTVYTLFSMETAPMQVTFTEGDPEEAESASESINGSKRTIHREKLIFLAAMNLFAEGGGVPMAPKASYIDGLLSFSGACDIPKWKTFFCLPLLVMARQDRIRGFESFEAPKAEIHLEKPVVLHADGEYCGDVTEAVFTCLKKKLKLLW